MEFIEEAYSNPQKNRQEIISLGSALTWSFLCGMGSLDTAGFSFNHTHTQTFGKQPGLQVEALGLELEVNIYTGSRCLCFPTFSFKGGSVGNEVAVGIDHVLIASLISMEK